MPFGKAAFFPGRLIHTNEFMVSKDSSSSFSLQIMEDFSELDDNKRTLS